MHSSVLFRTEELQALIKHLLTAQKMNAKIITIKFTRDMYSLDVEKSLNYMALNIRWSLVALLTECGNKIL